jgi:hypothetical protein
MGELGYAECGMLNASAAAAAAVAAAAAAAASAAGGLSFAEIDGCFRSTGVILMRAAMAGGGEGWADGTVSE